MDLKPGGRTDRKSLGRPFGRRSYHHYLEVLLAEFWTRFGRPGRSQSLKIQRRWRFDEILLLLSTFIVAEDPWQENPLKTTIWPDFFDPTACFWRCRGPATLLLALEGDDDDNFEVVWAIQQESCPGKVKVRLAFEIKNYRKNPARFLKRNWPVFSLFFTLHTCRVIWSSRGVSIKKESSPIPRKKISSLKKEPERTGTQ